MHIICDQAVIFHLRVWSGSNLTVNVLETKILDNWKENLATQTVLDEIIEALSFFLQRCENHKKPLWTDRVSCVDFGKTDTRAQIGHPLLGCLPTWNLIERPKSKNIVEET